MVDGADIVHESGMEGLLTAVALALKAGVEPRSITADAAGRREDMFALEFRVAGDAAQAARLWRYVDTELSPSSTRHLALAALADAPEVGMVVFNYLRLSLRVRRKIDLMHADSAVMAMHRLSGRVGGEIHRFKGLLRFRELRGGLLYAPFEPDHRIAYGLSAHFQRRLRGERWIIHDLRHDDAIHWDGARRHEAVMPPGFIEDVLAHGEVADEHLAPDERHWRELWRSFHSHAAVAGRDNPGLQRQFMPRRYWRFLTEMRGGDD